MPVLIVFRGLALQYALRSMTCASFEKCTATALRPRKPPGHFPVFPLGRARTFKETSISFWTGVKKKLHQYSPERAYRHRRRSPPERPVFVYPDMLLFMLLFRARAGEIPRSGSCQQREAAPLLPGVA